MNKSGAFCNLLNLVIYAILIGYYNTLVISITRLLVDR